MKNRVNNVKKQDHQEDFIQQGNFVMEQQLKMVIMRSKMQSIKSRARQKSQTASQKKSETFSKSFYTEQRNKQIKVYQNGFTKPMPQSLGTTFLINNQTQHPILAGEQKKIANIKNQRKTKSRSIGAYLRDPSLVHGVFPQQYYPIQAKNSGAFKFFPPLI